jgi:release factor glutamine methyltransferase
MKPNDWQRLAWRSPTTKLRAWLSHAYAQLAPVSENPALEAQLLLGHVLQQSRTWVVSHPEFALQPEQLEALAPLLERLVQREPLPYLLEKAEFFGLTFIVGPSVLIPRPETELLVQTAVRWLQAQPGRHRVVDVGTGSGVIAVALAVRCPDIHILAVDISREALKIARQNIDAHGVSDRVRLVQSNLLTGAADRFDLVCANLPYIPTGKLPDLDVSRYEPRLALDGGKDGLRWIERLLADLPGKLRPAGLVLLEIEAEQGESSLALARKYFPEANSSVLEDWAAQPRLLVVES